MEAVQSGERREEGAEPTTIRVRSEGLKLDLILLQNKVSGFTIDYQNISKVGELQRWIKIIDGMIPGAEPSQESEAPPREEEPEQPVFQELAPPEPLPQEEEEEPEQPDFQELAPPEPLPQEEEEAPEQQPVFQEAPPPAPLPQEEEEAPDLQAEKEVPQTDLMGEDDFREITFTAEEPLPQAPKPPEDEVVPQKELPRDNDMRKEEAPPPHIPEENDYRDIIHRAVDASLDTLGVDGKNAILSLLENRYGLREEEIPDHPRAFVLLLQELLGASAQTLEREIIFNIRKVSKAPGESLEAVIRSLKERGRRIDFADAASQDSEPTIAGFRYDATYVKRSN